MPNRRSSSFPARCLRLLATTLVLTGCSPAWLLNAVIPDDGYRLAGDLAYGGHPRQRLDVYIPRGLAEPAKVVVFFYGGSWQSGNRNSYRFVGEALTSRGFVTVIPDYRVYPEVLYPAFVEDGARAVRWVRDNIRDHGGDPQRIYLLGHSAGAHIAAMLNLNDAYLEPGTVRGMVGLAGPYDFLPLKDPILKIIFGQEPERPRTSLGHTQPINYVDGDEPPMLLLAGEDDTTVRPGNTQRLAVRVRERGGQAREILYPDVGHVEIVAALAKPLRGWAPTLEDVTWFVRNH